MPLAKYVKAEGERKRYTIEYVNWLDTGETVVSAQFDVINNTVDMPLVIDDVMVAPDTISVQYYVSGGKEDVIYDVLVTATTSGAQIKEDSLLFTIREPQ